MFRPSFTDDPWSRSQESIGDSSAEHAALHNPFEGSSGFSFATPSPPTRSPQPHPTSATPKQALVDEAKNDGDAVEGEEVLATPRQPDHADMLERARSMWKRKQRHTWYANLAHQSGADVGWAPPARDELPIDLYTAQITQAIRSNRVVIIVGG